MSQAESLGERRVREYAEALGQTVERYCEFNLADRYDEIDALLSVLTPEEQQSIRHRLLCQAAAKISEAEHLSDVFGWLFLDCNYGWELQEADSLEEVRNYWLGACEESTFANGDSREAFERVWELVLKGDVLHARAVALRVARGEGWV